MPGLSQSERERLWRHRGRVAEAAILLLAARALVAWVPFARWSGWFGQVAEAAREPAGGPPGGLAPAVALRARRVGRAVEAAALRLPVECKCLPQAMAASWMLRRRKLPGKLLFGVAGAKARTGRDDLHAWVTCGGETIVGEVQSPCAPILVLERDVELM